MNKSVFGSQTKRFLIRGQTGVFSSPMAIMFCIECIISFVHIPPGSEIHTVSNMLTFEILISTSVIPKRSPTVRGSLIRTWIKGDSWTSNDTIDTFLSRQGSSNHFLLFQRSWNVTVYKNVTWCNPFIEWLNCWRSIMNWDTIA